MKYTPPPGSTDANASYVTGNPVQKIKGSPVPAEAVEHPQREIVHVIEQAGLTPKVDDLSQLHAAIMELIRASGLSVGDLADGATIVVVDNKLAVKPSGIADGATITVSNGKLSVPDGSTTKKGVLQLYSGVDSASTAWAATAGAVKTAYDKAMAAAQASSGMTALEAYRQSRIGTPHHLSSTTLPAGYMWADGSLASFSDWPELDVAYNAGRFADMLLVWNASSYDKQNYPAKFVPNAANPSGLYLPRLGGLFSRNWVPGQGSAGAYNAPGVPNIYGRFGANRLGIYEGTNNQCIGPFSRYANNLAGGQYGAGIDTNTVSNYFMFNASYSSSLYGASSSVMPPSANMPLAVYLGVHA